MNGIQTIVEAILDTLIGNWLYLSFFIIFVIIDGVGEMFRGFAGIGQMRFVKPGLNDWGAENWGNDITISGANDGTETGTGILYYLFNTDLIRNLLISIALLGLFLLIVFTVMAFIKNAYSAKQKNWKEIVGNAFKGLANFVFVPVCCLLGVWVGNILLNAIDGATSSSAGTSMGSKLFMSCSYNANRVRTGSVTKEWGIEQIQEAEGDVYYVNGEKKTYKPNISSLTTDEAVASEIDRMFELGVGFKTYYNPLTVAIFYSTFNINYLVLVVGGVFMAYVLLTLVYAMIRRLFLLLMLFVISPGLCAMYPLDEGKAVGQWKSEFIKLVLSAYGAVAGMNLFYSILPLMLNVQMSSTNPVAMASLTILNVMGITSIVIMICGLLIVKEFISMISNLVGGEDAYSKGSSLRRSVKDAGKKATKAISGAFSVGAKAMGAAKYGKNKRESAGLFLKSLGSQARDSTFKGLGIDTKAIEDAYKKSYEDEGKEYKKRHDEAEGEAGWNKKRTTGENGEITTSLEAMFTKLTSKGKAISAEDIYELFELAGDEKSTQDLLAKKIAEHNSKYNDEYGKKTITGEKVVEANEKYKGGLKAIEKNHEAFTGYQKVYTDKQTADARLGDATTTLSKLGYKFDENGELLTNNINNQRLMAEVSDAAIEKLRTAMIETQENALTLSKSGSATPLEMMEARKAAIDAKKAYDSALDKKGALDEYNNAKSLADAFEQKMERAAETLQRTMEQVSETQKGAIKDAYGEAATEMQRVLTTNQGDMAKIIQEFEDATNKFNKSIESAAKTMSKGDSAKQNKIEGQHKL